MKVAVYSICGAGELPNIERYLASCKGADHVYVLLTAPDKAAYDALIDGGATVFRGCIDPFRFDDARNACLARVSPDVAACVALDMDETLEPGWREALENGLAPFEPSKPFAVWVDFNFNGQVFRQNNRVHSRYGWRWKHPCHEALVPSMARETFAVETHGFTITHRPDTSKPRPNYLEMLAWGQWEDPTSLRMLHYYGRELMFNSHYKDAIERFERYLYLDRMDNYFPAERMKTEEYLRECNANLHAQESSVMPAS